MPLKDILARNELLRAAGQLPGAKGTGTRVEIGAKATPMPLVVVPCVHEGAIIEFCPTCSGELRHVRDCAIHDRCTRGVVSAAVRACATCADYQPEKDGP